MKLTPYLLQQMADKPSADQGARGSRSFGRPGGQRGERGAERGGERRGPPGPGGPRKPRRGTKSIPPFFIGIFDRQGRGRRMGTSYKTWTSCERQTHQKNRGHLPLFSPY